MKTEVKKLSSLLRTRCLAIAANLAAPAAAALAFVTATAIGIATIAVAPQAHAAFLELNAFYYSDSFTQASSPATLTNTFLDGCLGFDVDSKGLFQIGWNYAMYSVATSTQSATTSYTSTQMGPKFNIYLSRARTWGLGLAYNLVTSATYAPSGGTSYLWKGTGYKVDFGYLWRMSESFALGLKINYASATYVDQFVDGTTYSAITASRTHIYPGLYMGLDF